MNFEKIADRDGTRLLLTLLIKYLSDRDPQLLSTLEWKLEIFSNHIPSIPEPVRSQMMEAAESARQFLNENKQR